ncbi:gamma carbonic anhydrase family protein [Thermodesulfobacteriota bacterium]
MIREFRGKKPIIASTAYVSDMACIIGDVEIGEHASVWPGAVIRADLAKITIGPDTSLEDNCVVHAVKDLIIGKGVIIGHGAVIHCLSIGDRVLVGNNATVLDDAEIGPLCIIGAGAVVKQGTKVPEHSLVIGAPASIKRKISSKHIKRLKNGAALYVKLAQEYKTHGF